MLMSIRPVTVCWSLIVEVELWISVHMRSRRMVVLGKSLPQNVSQFRGA